MLGRDCCAGPLAVARLRKPRWKAGRPRDEGAAVDFGELGRKRLWAERGKEKGNSFSFSENIFMKKKII
jgi:hypothetical protein